jgi:nucleoside 2-deoxyribosyltransferase
LFIRESLQRFRQDHPDPAIVAFTIMRFRDTREHKQIARAIKEWFVAHGISGVRADDKEYHDDLFPNTVTYMHGCGFGVAVFEGIEEENFNPNVSLEVGYMYALGKILCLLKDQTLTALHTDLVRKLYRPFDPYDDPKYAEIVKEVDALAEYDALGESEDQET